MFFTKRKAILLFLICLIFFFLTYQDVKSSEITSITGHAKVTDGDTIKINTFKIRLNGYFCTEKKHFLDENENRKWILIKNIKNYSFPKANHKLFKKLELNNWYA